MKIKINDKWKLRLYLIGIFMSLPAITGALLLFLQFIK